MLVFCSNAVNFCGRLLFIVAELRITNHTRMVKTTYQIKFSGTNKSKEQHNDQSRLINADSAQKRRPQQMRRYLHKPIPVKADATAFSRCEEEKVRQYNSTEV